MNDFTEDEAREFKDRLARELGLESDEIASVNGVTWVANEPIVLEPETALNAAEIPPEVSAPEPEVKTIRSVARAIVLEDDGTVWLHDPKDEKFVMLPGGGFEDGEVAEAAATRETLEETGLEIVIDKWLCQLSDEFARRDFFVAHRVGGEPASVDADGGGAVRTRRVPVAEAMQLLTSPLDRAALGMVATSEKIPPMNPRSEPPEQPLGQLLQVLLAGAVALQQHARQAHWLVRGLSFIGLHKLFGRVVDSSNEWIDLIGERIAQLGNKPHGAIKVEEFEDEDALAEVAFFAGVLREYARALRNGVRACLSAQDQVSADILIQAGRSVEKFEWLVRSHLGPGPSESSPAPPSTESAES